MPYKQRFQIVITYELETSLVQYERKETLFATWISEVGGFWAFFAILLKLIDYFDDVQLYVIADMIRPYRGKSGSLDLSQSKVHLNKNKNFKTYSPEKYQTNCCSGIRMKCVELCLSVKCKFCCCRKLCLGTKERVLINGEEFLKKELYVTDFIRHLRTTEGLLKEKLNIDKESWEAAMYKFSAFHKNAKKIRRKSTHVTEDQESGFDKSL